MITSPPQWEQFRMPLSHFLPAPTAADGSRPFCAMNSGVMPGELVWSMITSPCLLSLLANTASELFDALQSLQVFRRAFAARTAMLKLPLAEHRPALHAVLPQLLDLRPAESLRNACSLPQAHLI